MILESTPTQDLPDISAPYPFQTIVRLHAKCGRAVRLDSLAAELSLVLIVVRPPVSPSRLHRMPRPVCAQLM